METGERHFLQLSQLLGGKILHQSRESYRYALPLKNRVDWISTRKEEHVTTSKLYTLKKS